MPPPMPLSGTGAWYSAGSQPSSARSSAKRGRISSHASSGELERSIAARTSAMNDRTTGVSSTNSSATRHLRQGGPSGGEQLQPPEREIGDSADAEAPDDLQPRLRQRIVDADAHRHRGQRGHVDAVQVPVAAVRVEQ